MVDIFVACVGTGGTVSGTGRRLKEHSGATRVVAVEPASSPLLSTGKSGPHKIQGIGANFVPKTYDASVVDEIVTVTDDEAMQAARQAGRQRGAAGGHIGGRGGCGVNKNSHAP